MTGLQTAVTIILTSGDIVSRAMKTQRHPVANNDVHSTALPFVPHGSVWHGRDKLPMCRTNGSVLLRLLGLSDTLESSAGE
jgi:hypothetical protein